MDRLQYLQDMYYCGTNTKVKVDSSFTDKIMSPLKGAQNKMLPSVRVMDKEGIREGKPFAYYPGLDYTFNEAYARFAIEYKGKEEDWDIVFFRLFQLKDTNMKDRLAGFREAFVIDKTDTGEYFRRFGLPNINHLMPVGIKQVLHNQDPKLYYSYIRPLIENYEKALSELSTLYTNVIYPLEAELELWKNSASVHKQLSESGGLGQIMKNVDAISSIGSGGSPRLSRMAGQVTEDML